MIAFIYQVMRLLAFEDDDWNAPSRRRHVEASEMVEVLAANLWAVLLLAGTMTGLASIFVHVIRIIQAQGGSF